MDTSELAQQLRSVLAGALGTPLEVQDVRRLPGGASRETWSFSARRADGSGARFVLRRDPPGAPMSGLRIEAALLQAAARVDVPVPRVVATGDGEPDLGTFMIMDFVEGETIARRILREDDLARARRVLAEQCGRALAAIHRIDPLEVPGLPGGDP